MSKSGERAQRLDETKKSTGGGIEAQRSPMMS